MARYHTMVPDTDPLIIVVQKTLKKLFFAQILKLLKGNITTNHIYDQEKLLKMCE